MIPMSAVPGYENSRPGIQVGTKMEGELRHKAGGGWEYSREGARFLRQMGIEWVMINDPGFHSAAAYRELKEQLAEEGLRIYRLANNQLHNMPGVTLGLADRDELIDRYLEYITNLGEAGIHYATYAHMGNGIWRGDFRREVRGGATAGGLDLNQPNHSTWAGIRYDWPLSHGREYSEDEIWENYEYFIKKVVPVAESAGVYIGIHPDDPPVYSMGGVPRCVFGSFEGYKKALEIANSDHIGVCLCVGCWLEGGAKMGMDTVDFIHWLMERKKLFKLHVRNVTGSLDGPDGFNETFPDAGYYDLTRVIKALDETGFDGAIMNDHLIDVVGGHYTAEAYFTSYLKGVVDAIQNNKT